MRPIASHIGGNRGSLRIALHGGVNSHCMFVRSSASCAGAADSRGFLTKDWTAPKQEAVRDAVRVFDVAQGGKDHDALAMHLIGRGGCPKASVTDGGNRNRARLLERGKTSSPHGGVNLIKDHVGMRVEQRLRRLGAPGHREYEETCPPNPRICRVEGASLIDDLVSGSRRAHDPALKRSLGQVIERQRH